MAALLDDWPLVATNDDGIRPAGPLDACFYCARKVGQPHAFSCITVSRRVKVRYSFEIEIDVPHFWDAHLVEFSRNDGSWCASNALEEIEAFQDRSGDCLCGVFHCDYVDSVDSTPRKVT